jgi:UDP-glucose 4-epimerase
MILVTGGAGYIGSHVCKKLHKLGYDIVVFDNLITGHKEFVKWGEFVLGDLNSPEQLKLVFSKYPIKAVMHFAAFAYVHESVREPKKYYLNNVCNTLNLLQVMLEYDVRYFVFSSTCAIYGFTNNLLITENHPKKPISPYGKSKLFVEKILEDYSKAYDLKYISLRYFNAAGADFDAEIGEWHEPEPHLIPLLLDCAINKSQTFNIYGADYETFDGTCVRDFIHVVDLADAHVLALEYLFKENKCNIFNLGTGNGFSVKQVLSVVEEVTKRKINYLIKGRREGDPPILIASNEKAKKILHWEPKYSDLLTIISSAWEWHQKLYIEFKK